jgi:hypothetical protein
MVGIGRHPARVAPCNDEALDTLRPADALFAMRLVVATVATESPRSAQRPDIVEYKRQLGMRRARLDMVGTSGTRRTNIGATFDASPVVPLMRQPL